MVRYAFLCVRYRQPADDVFLRGDRRILGLFAAIRQARYERVEIGVAKERDGLAFRRDAFGLADLLRGGRDDTVESRPQDVVTPAGEEVTGVDHNRAGLGDTLSQQTACLRKAQLYLRLGELAGIPSCVGSVLRGLRPRRAK